MGTHVGCFVRRDARRLIIFCIRECPRDLFLSFSGCETGIWNADEMFIPSPSYCSSNNALDSLRFDDQTRSTYRTLEFESGFSLSVSPCRRVSCRTRSTRSSPGHALQTLHQGRLGTLLWTTDEEDLEGLWTRLVPPSRGVRGV